MRKKRINAIISQIEYDTLADIGCDHAFIPIFAMEVGLVKKAIAIDIANGPLLNAEKNIFRKGLVSQIKTRLGSGLKPLLDGEVACITIAGMGCETIIEILEDLENLPSISQIIISPHTKLELFREFIENSNFYIKNEIAVEEGKKVYTIFNCKREEADR
ncbi:MAG: class I SAM-dependent methyltransferase [Defluviitaleaceae bacterium]|nr:class I SAM-dependent methyltransferase [Defluviitaleaceae bacterium]